MKSSTLFLFLGIALLLGGGGFAVYEMTRGIRNNNPGNIVYDANNDWLGQTGEDGEFATFSAPIYGLRAMGKTLISYVNRGIPSTVNALIRTWSKTDQDAYVANISKWLNVGPNDTIDVKSNLPLIMAGITKQENGMNPYDSATLTQAAQMAVSS